MFPLSFVMFRCVVNCVNCSSLASSSVSKNSLGTDCRVCSTISVGRFCRLCPAVVYGTPIPSVSSDDRQRRL